MKSKNMHVVSCPPCGESTLKGGKGVVNKRVLFDNPPSALRATSKAEKLFDNPPTPLRGTSPARGAEKAALCAKHPAGGEVNGGFTLIELLVVVLIIGILAAVAVPQYQNAVLKSRYSMLMAGTKAIAEAEELYFLKNGKYTRNMDELDVAVKSTCDGKHGAEAETADCTSGLTFQINETYVYASLTIRNITPLYYSIYFKHTQDEHAGKQLCVVNTKYRAEKKFHKVCQSLGGNYTGGRDYYLN